MLSKAQISLITSLQHKKFRTQHCLFVVEGIKSVLEFVNSAYKINKIFATVEGIAKLGKIPQIIKLEEVSEHEFSKISSLKTPQGALALVEIPQDLQLNFADFQGKHSLILDDIQDPGNLGTIIRTAEWFGIENIICSIGTVDAYNPKVVQATMGSLSRIKLHYVELEEFIEKKQLPVFGALLDGSSIYETDFGKEGFIMMGNEGNGIRKSLISQVDKAVTIPRVGQAESLNVAVATTIFCSELTRQNMEKKNG
ncbi:RNA methyltransferase [Sphingobacterium daejeonense]|uniref:TrmH family RNA methyltransferase n=1 Tax=Sphingobacterium daejeonense TaxID=371142 RepID=UPI0021A83115|nr:RNA methyltransferase [Sphingobacterium daejeonense]MCT1530253.1 RNA methyltransferase [Sphingobacterium daejeonense]